jgi:hypothetical protein
VAVKITIGSNLILKEIKFKTMIDTDTYGEMTEKESAKWRTIWQLRWINFRFSKPESQ